MALPTSDSNSSISIDEKLPSDVLSWTPENVFDFLTENSLKPVGEILQKSDIQKMKDQEINGETLLELEIKEMQGIGFTLGRAKCIARIVKRLKKAKELGVDNTADLQRTATHDEPPRPKKRLRAEDHHASSKNAARLTTLIQKISLLPDDPSKYSNPMQVITIPFPSLCPIPRRFAASRSPSRDFLYSGREMFRELWETWQTVDEEDLRQREIYVHGTMGYGKSHILAAFAALLLRKGHRVVYLPDCRALLKFPMDYLQHAFMMALSATESPENAKLLAQVLDCHSIEHLVQLCTSISDLCFIIDQENALDPQEFGDNNTDAAKADVRMHLASMHFNRTTITSASANHMNFKFLQQKQLDEVLIAMLGGMSQTEMNIWWSRHADKFSHLTPNDKHLIEDLTGNVPLLLQPFLEPGIPINNVLESTIWDQKTLRTVGDRVRDFIGQQMRSNPNRDSQRDYMRQIRACLTNTNICGSGPTLDHRYFYLNAKGDGRYTCGLARQAMMAYFREVEEEGVFLSLDWRAAIRSFRNNPSVLGFMIEAVIISAISSSGLNTGKLRIKETKIIPFQNDVAEVSTDPSAFYVPTRFNCKAIDALYAEVDKVTRRAHLVPIQITIAKEHKDSETAFFRHWRKWAEPLSKYDIEWSFLWVVPNKRAWELVEEKQKKLRNVQKVTAPKFRRACVTLDQIDKELGDLYSDISSAT